MANFIKLDRAGGPQDLSFFLNAEHITQYGPSNKGGSTVCVAKGPAYSSLGLPDDISVKQTTEEIDDMLTSRTDEKGGTVSFYFTEAFLSSSNGNYRPFNSEASIHVDDVFAIILNNLNDGKNTLVMMNGHSYEISNLTTQKIIPQRTGFTPEISPAALSNSVFDKNLTHRPQPQKAVQLTFNF